jgi:DNA invertase Pin-like site-specific DNA recombinase
MAAGRAAVSSGTANKSKTSWTAYNNQGKGATMATNNALELIGQGACYIRVSGDRQEVERQLASIATFEQRHKVKIAPTHRYEDDMPRDLSAKRPDFQRMLRAARAGLIKWVVVDAIDRFGFRDEWELVEFLQDLRKAGCKLLDTKDDVWTDTGLMGFFKAGLAGHASHDEQVQKSKRSLGGMVAKARQGEWQGGPPQLGFDVACFDRATNVEQWRVVFEGRDKVGTTTRRGKERPVYHIRRRKVFPNGRKERLDGNVEFRTSKDTQVMRIVPTQDKARLAAARDVFRRYASEAVTFFQLAKYLNGLGIRNSFGNRFQGKDISKLLADESYLGFPTFGKRRNGRFHRHDADGGITELEPELRGKDTANDPADVIRSTTRLFEPLVDRPTWDKVQRKLRARPSTTHAPKNPELYLAGLVVCAGCGAPMVARTDRLEYYCATWDKHRVRGALADCPCQRNGVRQALLRSYIDRYLAETQTRLELLTQRPDGRHLTDELEKQDSETWLAFREGIDRLAGYIATHHPAEYQAILNEMAQRDAEQQELEARYRSKPVPPGGLAAKYGERLTQAAEAHKADETKPACDDFAAAILKTYRTHFDPKARDAEMTSLQEEHERLISAWIDLPTERAKATAKARLEALDARIGALEQQGADAANVVAAHLVQLDDLQKAITDARQALRSETGAQALRALAEALKSVLCRIECKFVLTGKGGRGGPGLARSRLVALTFVPVAGDVRAAAAEGAELTGANGRFQPYGKP